MGTSLGTSLGNPLLPQHPWEPAVMSWVPPELSRAGEWLGAGRTPAGSHSLPGESQFEMTF